MRSLVLPAPRTGWRWTIRKRQNLPRALGTTDGKHTPLRCPTSAGSRFFNYKGFHSLVLLALVDADNKFIWFDTRKENNTNGFPLAESLVDHGPKWSTSSLVTTPSPSKTGTGNYSHAEAGISMSRYLITGSEGLSRMPLGFWPADFRSSNPPCSNNLLWSCG